MEKREEIGEWDGLSRKYRGEAAPTGLLPSTEVADYQLNEIPEAPKPRRPRRIYDVSSKNGSSFWSKIWFIKRLFS